MATATVVAAAFSAHWRAASAPCGGFRAELTCTGASKGVISLQEQEPLQDGKILSRAQALPPKPALI